MFHPPLTTQYYEWEEVQPGLRRIVRIKTALPTRIKGKAAIKVAKKSTHTKGHYKAQRMVAA